MEPTLSDVITVLEKHGTQIANLTDKVTIIGLNVLDVKTEVYELSRRVGSVEVTLEDLRDSHVILQEAFDKDSKRIMNYEKRIKKLEHVRFA